MLFRALKGVKAWCCKRLSDANRTTPSERMDNACRGSLITSASTDNRPQGFIPVYQPACGEFLHLACLI